MNWRNFKYCGVGLLAHCLLTVVGCCLFAQAQDAPPTMAAPDYKIEVGIPYAQGTNGDLLADLYLPAKPGLRPAVLFLHGGGWKSGDRSQLKRVIGDLSSEGYAGMAIDYDLTSQDVRFPVALEQSKEAIRWLRAHAAQYRIDPNRIAVAGSSAGGELAALVGLTENDRRYEKGANLAQSSSVNAVIVFNGVLDLSYVGAEADGDMVERYLGAACETAKAACSDASPVDQIRDHAPPFFVGHGTADQIVPYSQAINMVEKLRKQNVPVTPFVADGANHTYWASSRWYDANVQAVKTFLAKWLGKSDR